MRRRLYVAMRWPRVRSPSARAAHASRTGHREAGPASRGRRREWPTAGSILGSPAGERGTWNAVDNRICYSRKAGGGRSIATPPQFPRPARGVSKAEDQPGSFPALGDGAVHLPHATRVRTLYAMQARRRRADGRHGVRDRLHRCPEQKRIYITQTGGPHSFRPIFMDGRPHPKDLDPELLRTLRRPLGGRYAGHRHVGFNERSWIDHRGMPTTDQLHTDRTHHAAGFQHAALRNDHRRSRRLHGTVDDRHVLPVAAGAEQFEFVCQDGNLAPLLMIGGENVKLIARSRVCP